MFSGIKEKRKLKKQIDFTMKATSKIFNWYFKSFLQLQIRKIVMTLVSVFNSKKSKYLIHSQISIIQTNFRVFLRLNTDNLGSGYWYDGFHFNSLGHLQLDENMLLS